MRILVIDDDRPTQVLVEALFRPLAFLVESAFDGTEALHLLRTRTYDAIVLDLLLPCLNGFDLLRAMKSHDEAMLARTVVVTAVSSHTLRDFTDQNLVRRVLRKPFDVDELMREVLSCRPPDAAPFEAVR